MSDQIKIFIVIGILVGALVFSTPSGGKYPPTVRLDQTVSDVVVYGALESESAGRELASGDINGDGLVDLIVFSSSARPFDRGVVGRTDIVWGVSPLDSVVDLQNTSGVSRILGATGSSGTFTSVNSADINSDGFDDVIIGVPSPGDGKAYVVFGSAAFPDTVDLETASEGIVRLYGVNGEQGWFGFRSASGDIDGDGYLDLLISAPSGSPGGQVFVISGRDSFPEVISMTTAAPGIKRIIDPLLFEATGTGLACDDVDADGFADILIGSPGENPATLDGNATLLFGSDMLPDTVYLADPSIRQKLILPVSVYSSGRLGHQAEIADVNGDGHLDMLLTAYQAEPLGCRSCGEMYVIFGPIDALPDTVHLDRTDLPISRLIGGGNDSHYSKEIDSGDIDADGFDDVMIFSENNSAPNAGPFKVTVYYGSPTGYVPTLVEIV